MYPDLDIKHLASLVLHEIRTGKNKLDISDIKNSEQLLYKKNGGFDMSDQRWHGGGGGTPGGSTTQLQYNNNGAFGGIAHATYDTALGSISVIADDVSDPDKSGGIVIEGGVGVGDNLGGGVFISGGNAGAGTADGGNSLIYAGNGGTTSGNGGQVSLSSGTGGPDGDGGSINLGAANGGSGDTDGGLVTINGGLGSGTGNNGNIKIGSDSVLSTATGGFMNVPSTINPPTGVPQYPNGALVFDRVHNKLWIFGTTWKSIQLT